MAKYFFCIGLAQIAYAGYRAFYPFPCWGAAWGWAAAMIALPSVLWFLVSGLARNRQKVAQ
ncbi:MAG: hypothetical protein UX02_C0001G0033 [Candidatus Moranbacteria bacterium GW2011_GWC1_45_18]|nr:MAG: hypothetical protein UT79_C0002G0364 [Candidatus Moranbacteria bacterium GW2011_GWC2_40_12]KKT34205.1 MAG: hypothetical protein UW19_C0001G0100 [Candidatus Moranbacteria bacterium GW2011_GWF2_44_10]KKT72395.1 MAG: hypothetical protein UW66_C0004G0008 [Candidatus Moranbacteria bacterium GW2011_GWF1_44_4]KKU00585.1 MAG: hypothetical protein UX02_C0001G0033 [Candidatus Moranbacteria bacterium GW2011_GWC1_45_18]OGI39093.1 MAG: hypothetical protein A2374_04905 [Candidatus Moranbacteria bacte